MAQPINVGVDFGSLGWRAAYQQGDRTALVSEGAPDALLEKWLLCEPSHSNSLGMAFPSLKSKLGSGVKLTVNGKARTPDDLVTEELRAIKLRIEVEAGQQAGQTVLCVPAGYSASRRAALRDAALKAGFTDAHLLNDSMAAVINYTGQSQQSATLLVYSLGYAGFEIGLVRAVRGRYRTLGYEASHNLSGAGWDEMILRAWLSCFSEQNLVLNPPPQQWSASIWLQVRLAAQQVKEDLSQAEEAPFPIAVQFPNSPNPLSVSFQRNAWQTAIGPSVNATLDLAEKVLAGSNLAAGDLDAILLVGGGVRCPLIPDLFESRFKKRPVVLDAYALAQGAALYATRLEAAPLPATPLGEEAGAIAETPEVAAAESAIVATVAAVATTPAQPSGMPLLTAVSRPERRAQPAAPSQDVVAAGREVLLQHVHRLIERGEAAQAELFLHQLIQDAQKLFEAARPSAPSPPQQSTPSPSQKNAERAIARAYQLLKEGKLDQAVPQSHLAWQLLPDSPEIFDKMIDIHCQAAMAKSDVESYDSSIHWLECALSHDQSNSRTLQSLAERHYLQGKHLAERNRRKEAMAAIEKCLYWNPEHEKAIELNAVLNK